VRAACDLAAVAIQLAHLGRLVLDEPLAGQLAPSCFTAGALLLENGHLQGPAIAAERDRPGWLRPQDAPRWPVG
jgi:hypothetical protein